MCVFQRKLEVEFTQVDLTKIENERDTVKLDLDEKLTSSLFFRRI